MGMDKVPWVSNGWVQLPWVGNGSGMGTVVKPNAGLWFVANFGLDSCLYSFVLLQKGCRHHFALVLFVAYNLQVPKHDDI
jgi:hypothetical protein